MEWLLACAACCFLVGVAGGMWMKVSAIRKWRRACRADETRPLLPVHSSYRSVAIKKNYGGGQTGGRIYRESNVNRLVVLPIDKIPGSTGSTPHQQIQRRLMEALAGFESGNSDQTIAEMDWQFLTAAIASSFVPALDYECTKFGQYSTEEKREKDAVGAFRACVSIGIELGRLGVIRVESVAEIVQAASTTLCALLFHEESSDSVDCVSEYSQYIRKAVK